MSSSRGNIQRTRPQKHQNKTAYKNDLHDKTNKTKFLNSLSISGVCKRCKDILDWKIKYKKYKPLTSPRKCVGCEEKTVKYAYHVLCGKCAAEKNVCAKCCTSVEVHEPEENTPNVDVQTMLKGLPERKRRTIIRFINKTQGEDNKLSPDMTSRIVEMIQNMDQINLDDDDDFDGFASDDEQSQNDSDE
ncbi:hypothetical protein MSG28_000367 [Choristoneura fumiferana]|uniref:Uncharacterized protein n=1 Tax=Choristoneura fumiferana TaxID=7141 RepID=A0ACC0K0I9_CHOFU|nr:hypothetical protein MSG28_000367 [Choristoneura fumiferana]